MNECSEKFETEYLKKNGMPAPGPCFPFHPSQKTIWPDVMKYCTQVSFVWAVGSPLVSLKTNLRFFSILFSSIEININNKQVQDFPTDIGYPVGGSGRDFTYFFMEMHYDNPELKSSKTLKWL